MGLRDYYRQFEALTEEEVNAAKRAEAVERRARELARVDPLDLTLTTWPEVPPHTVVNAITFAARRGLHRYPDAAAGALRSELAHRHGVAADRVVIGHGAASLITDAVAALAEPGDELVTPWPSYGLYPLAARRARAAAVPVPGFSVEAILSAVTDRTRIVTVCNPNDPTGELLGAGELRALLDALPERVVVLLDEALRDFVDAEPVDAALALLDDHPRLLVVRTFSKAWGLAGLRCGYVVGAPGAEPLLARLSPDLGIDELAEAGVLEALRHHGHLAAERAARVHGHRTELAAAARAAGLEVATSQANVLWLAAPALDGGTLAAELGRRGVLAASGGALGDPRRVRLTVPARPDGVTRVARAFASLRD